MTASCARMEDAPAFALGALPEHEVAGYAAHLTACPACAGRVAELEFVVGCLAVAVPQHDPPRALRDRLMTEVRAEAELLRAAGPLADRPQSAPRRRRLPRLAAALRPLGATMLACALLAVGAGGGLLLGDDDDPRSRTVAASVSAAGAPAATAELRVSEMGSRLVVDGMPAPPAGRIYQVWLDHPDDSQAPEPTDVLFSVSRDGRASVDVPGDLRDVSAVLVTDEPEGGSPLPTRRPVITAQPS